MVILNISTQSDLSNGTRGEIIDIILDPRDINAKANMGGNTTRLQYPPTLIFFKPVEHSVPSFPGLEQGVMPIFPSERKSVHEGLQSITLENNNINERRRPAAGKFLPTSRVLQLQQLLALLGQPSLHSILKMTHSLLLILTLSLAGVASAANSCLAFDINWNLLAFGFNGKDYNAGTMDTWATGM